MFTSRRVPGARTVPERRQVQFCGNLERQSTLRILPRVEEFPFEALNVHFQ